MKVTPANSVRCRTTPQPRGSAAAAGRRGLGHHRVGVAAEKSLAERVEQHRAHEHHGDECIGKRIAANVLQAVINLHRGHARVVEDQRDAEVGEGPDEHDGAAGKEARLDQRQGDLEKPPEARAPEVFGGLLHRRVDVGQGSNRVEIDDGVEAEGVDQRDAEKLVRAEPVEGPPMRPQAEVDDQAVERTVLAEDLLDADGADERRQDHRHEDEGSEKALQRKKEAVRVEGEGQGDQQGERRGGQREQEGIAQAAQINRIGQQRGEVGEAIHACRRRR